MDVGDNRSAPHTEPMDDPSAPLRIEVQRDDRGAYVVTAVGDIDLSTIPVLQASLAAVLDESPVSVGFELSDVGFIDSSGIAVLLEVAGAGPRVGLVNPSQAVRRVIELSGLETILPVIA